MFVIQFGFLCLYELRHQKIFVCIYFFFVIYHRDSRQEFAKVGGIFPILHVVLLLDASNQVAYNISLYATCSN